MILAFKVFLYNNAELLIMIKQIGLIAMVAIGLTLVSPGIDRQVLPSSQDRI